MSEPSFGLPSRRDFLRTSGGAAGWMVLAARFPSAAHAAREARRMATGEAPASLVFFEPAEASRGRGDRRPHHSDAMTLQGRAKPGPSTSSTARWATSWLPTR